MPHGVIMREELFEAFRASSRFGTAEKNLKSIVDSGGGRQWVQRQLNVLPSSINYPRFVSDGAFSGTIEYRKSQDDMHRNDYFRRLQFMKESQFPLLDRLHAQQGRTLTPSKCCNPCLRCPIVCVRGLLDELAM